MPRPTPTSLQPSLLDRLTDDEPEKKVEAAHKRTLSLQQLRACVRRDMGSLLNTDPLGTVQDLSAFPLVEHSVINYGFPNLSGLTVNSKAPQDLEQVLRQVIVDFEPRILADSLKVVVRVERDREGHEAVAFSVEGELWADPVPVDMALRGTVDFDNGAISIDEGLT